MEIFNNEKYFKKIIIKKAALKTKKNNKNKKTTTKLGKKHLYLENKIRILFEKLEIEFRDVDDV